MIDEGSKAPEIRAPSTTGPFRLDEYLDAGPLVLFFYFKASTPG
jgi:peroxiredoxin